MCSVEKYRKHSGSMYIMDKLLFINAIISTLTLRSIAVEVEIRDE